jgi:ABC-type polar amino acid transport system ATPase subunit
LGSTGVLGRGKEESERRGMLLLDRVGLREHTSKFPGQLSGGQQQRVAIVRALAMDPIAMLFDEPTSALDPEMINEVLEVLDVMVAGRSSRRRAIRPGPGTMHRRYGNGARSPIAFSPSPASILQI